VQTFLVKRPHFLLQTFFYNPKHFENHSPIITLIRKTKQEYSNFKDFWSSATNPNYAWSLKRKTTHEKLPAFVLFLKKCCSNEETKLSIKNLHGVEKGK
jgi:hypothetical protein